ncbi:MAG: hypothetical protein KAH14_09175, partial [Clostridiales bacterium]|nr:hypothetical protein [Clostridiales bacterium]
KEAKNESGRYSDIRNWIKKHHEEFNDMQTDIYIEIAPNAFTMTPNEFNNCFPDSMTFILNCCFNWFAATHPNNQPSALKKMTLIKEEACMKDSKLFRNVFENKPRGYSPTAWHDNARNNSSWSSDEQKLGYSGDYNVKMTDSNRTEKLVERLFKTTK